MSVWGSLWILGLWLLLSSSEVLANGKKIAFKRAEPAESTQYVQSRGIHKLYHEQTLERKLKTLLAYNKHMRYDSDLTVTVYRSSVIVIGRVSQPEDLKFVKDSLSTRVPQLKQELFIGVATKAENPVSRSRDQLLKLQVRAELLRGCGWVAGQIRVVVYKQHVYLIGPISKDVKRIMTRLKDISEGVTVIGRN